MQDISNFLFFIRCQVFTYSEYLELISVSFRLIFFLEHLEYIFFYLQLIQNVFIDFSIFETCQLVTVLFLQLSIHHQHRQNTVLIGDIAPPFNELLLVYGTEVEELLIRTSSGCLYIGQSVENLEVTVSRDLMFVYQEKC